MRKKLTASVIAKLSVPEGKSYIKLFDTEVTGLGVRITASGVASFIFVQPKQRVWCIFPICWIVFSIVDKIFYDSI